MDKEIGYYQTLTSQLQNDLGNYKEQMEMLEMQLSEQSRMTTLEFPLVVRKEKPPSPTLNLEGKGTTNLLD